MGWGQTLERVKRWPTKLYFSPARAEEDSRASRREPTVVSSFSSDLFNNRAGGCGGGHLAGALSGFIAVSLQPTVATFIGKENWGLDKHAKPSKY